MLPQNFDYIIVGGGTAGCVVASRLAQYLPTRSVAVIEVGKDAHSSPLVQSSFGAVQLHGTEYHWNDKTVPQVGSNGRQIEHGGGRMLSGSSGVNYATWTRGHREDFNRIAEITGDDGWSYEALLPYFKRTETHYSSTGDVDASKEHGTAGPIHTMQSPEYPLGETILSALKEAGISKIADANSGDPVGVARWVHNWRENSGSFVRQPAGQVYDLSRVTVITEKAVTKIVMLGSEQTTEASGVMTADGQYYTATKEVIICCGALRTPQLLMLSGIGDAKYLEKKGIKTLVDLPEVGQNLHDHSSTMLFWKLKHPEEALAIGHPDFNSKGIAPGEFLLTGTVSQEKLAPALKKDGVRDPMTHSSLSKPRAHYEVTFGYYPAGAEPGLLPMDGSIITTGVSNFLPTARGSISLRSNDISDPPLIDPAYLSTEHDICVLREAVRALMRVMDTQAAKTEIGEQFQISSQTIQVGSSDEEIDRRLRETCMAWYHPAGTAALGKVIDGECRVFGARKLRIVDASIFPEPIAAHYQAPVYAIAEKAAEMIATAD